MSALIYNEHAFGRDSASEFPAPSNQCLHTSLQGETRALVAVNIIS